MKHKENPSYIDLFLSFLWIGLSGFGGLAMTAHIRKHVVDKRKWIDEGTFDAGLALCQIITGAIVMQLAAYIGLKLKGNAGAVLCSFVGILAVITFRFSLGIHWNLFNILFTLIAFVLLVKKVDVIWIILGGILLSLIF